MYGDVSDGHADPDNPVVDTVDLDEFSAGVFSSREEALIDTLPDDTHFPLVADVDVVDETSEHDVRFFNLLVLGIQSFQRSRDFIFVVDGVDAHLARVAVTVSSSLTCFRTRSTSLFSRSHIRPC